MARKIQQSNFSDAQKSSTDILFPIYLSVGFGLMLLGGWFSWWFSGVLLTFLDWLSGPAIWSAIR